MAVFPERIVLKNSTDPSADLSYALGYTYPIVPGEIVVGRETDSVKLYALDSSGAVRAVGGSGSGGLAYWGGGNFDTGVSDGQQADGGSFD